MQRVLVLVSGGRGIKLVVCILCMALVRCTMVFRLYARVDRTMDDEDAEDIFVRPSARKPQTHPMGSSLLGSLFRARHPYEKDPKRDPDLENSPKSLKTSSHEASHSDFPNPEPQKSRTR